MTVEKLVEAQENLVNYIDRIIAHRDGYHGIDAGKHDAKYLVHMIVESALSTTTHDEAIRRECAEKAAGWFLNTYGDYLINHHMPVKVKELMEIIIGEKYKSNSERYAILDIEPAIIKSCDNCTHRLNWEQPKPGREKACQACDDEYSSWVLKGTEPAREACCLSVDSVNAGLDVGLNGEQASRDSIDAYRSNPFTHRIADTIRYSKHDEAIRRECADRAVAWYNAPFDMSMDHENNDEYWDNALRSAILNTEPAREESK